MLSCFVSFRLPILKREVDARKGSRRKESRRKGCSHDRFSNAEKALGWPNFLNLSIVFCPIRSYS